MHQRDKKIALVDADTNKVGGFASAVVVDEDIGLFTLPVGVAG